MPTQSLTLRRNQIVLLADACQSQVTARVVRRRGGTPPLGPNTQLLALDDNAVWIRAPHSGLLPAHWDGSTVDVTFERGGEDFRFTAETCGRFERTFGDEGTTAVLRLSLPIRVERYVPQERRQHERVDICPTDAISARVVHVTNKQQQFTLQLTDVSLGGCAGRMAALECESIGAQDLFWAEIALDPDQPPLDFVAQMVHARPADDDDAYITGWRFCAGDDETGYRRNLSRLQEFVAQRRQTPT